MKKLMIVLVMGMVMLFSCKTTAPNINLKRGEEAIFPKKDLLGRTVGIIVVVRDENDQLQVYDSDYGPGGNYVFKQDSTGKIIDKGSYPAYPGYGGYGAQGSRGRGYPNPYNNPNNPHGCYGRPGL